MATCSKDGILKSEKPNVLLALNSYAELKLRSYVRI